MDGSEFDFCVDEGIVCMQCSFQEHSVSSNHTERSLVSVFSQDIYSVVDVNWNYDRNCSEREFLLTRRAP